MTNEEIVARIQNGEAGLLDMLLEQNRGIIWRVAMRYRYQAERNRGLDGEDLLQAARLGMVEAVPFWDAERGMFLTVATLYMRKSIRGALGIRTAKERIENVAPPASLSAPVGEDNSDSTLGDCIADPNAIDPQLAAEEALMDEFTRRTVREAVEGLPEPQRSVVWGYYLEGRTVLTMAEQIGLDPDNIRTIQRKGVRHLGRNRALCLLWAEYEAVPYWHQTLAEWKNNHTSAVEAAAMKREELLGIINGAMENA